MDTRKRKNESKSEYHERASKFYYSNGYSIKEIAKKLKIDELEVYNFITTGRKVTTSKEREEMIELYNKGYSITAIAKMFNKSRACIKKRIAAPAQINTGSGYTLSNKEINIISEMINEGKSIQSIARKLGVKTTVIRYRLDHMPRKRITYVDKYEANKFIYLFKKGKSYKEIAKMCGRARTTVERHIHKAGYWRKNGK